MSLGSRAARARDARVRYLRPQKTPPGSETPPGRGYFFFLRFERGCCFPAAAGCFF